MVQTASRLAMVVLCLVCGSSTSTYAQEKDSLQQEPQQLSYRYESSFVSLQQGRSRSLQFEEPMLIMEEDLLEHNETLDDHGDELFLNETDHDADGDHDDEDGDLHMDGDEHHDDEEGEDHHDEEGEDHHDEEGEDHHDEEGEDHHDDEHQDDHDDEHDHGSDASLFMDNHDDDDSSDKPWGEVIVASILINLVTLVGVIFLTGEVLAKHVFKRDVANSPYYYAFTHNIIPSFACGALLATTLFLVLPESLFLISAHFAGGEEDHDEHDDHRHRFMEEEDHDDHGEEGGAIWRFGTCVISGFLLPVLTSMLFPHSHDGLEKEDASQASPVTVAETDKLTDVPEDVAVEEGAPEEDVGTLPAPATTSQLEKRTSNLTAGSATSSDGSDVVVTTDDEPLPYAIDYSLAASIMAGDFFHNFADGIFVGTAFMLCSRDLAITISAATIYHEVAQEVADYFMLTRFCHIPPIKALGLNFVNGLSVLFGACLIVGIDDITNVAVGSILGVSGGVYIYIAVAECFPRAKLAQKTLKDKLMSLLAFVFGVIPIGLVLMNHGHCEAGGHDDH